MESPAVPEDMTGMPGAWDYPHMIALLIVVIAVTVLTALRAATRREELKGGGPLINILGCLVLTSVTFLQAIFFYLLPALVVAWTIKLFIAGAELSPDTFAHVYIDPALKLATLICLLDNFADGMATRNRVGFGVHFLQFVVIVIPAYVVMMCVSWLLARMIGATGVFEPEYVEPACRLLTVPSFVPSTVVNMVTIGLLVVAAASISYPLRLKRIRVLEVAERLAGSR